MKKRYEVTVGSVQTWAYVYEVEAEDEDEAQELGMKAHKNGDESIDNWVIGEEFYQFNDAELIRE
jgi:hypothetical protein